MSFDLKSVIGAVAPTLADMMAGPLAGEAVTALEGAFGVAPGSGTDGITKVIQSGNVTPDIIAKVRAADQKHAEIIAQQGLDLKKLNAAHQEALEKLEAADRDSARKREEVVKDPTPARLAYLSIGGFFLLSIAQLAVLMGFGDVAVRIPSQGWLLIGTITGYLATEAKAASSYYFGTSSGEDRKTDIISQLPPLPGNGAPK